MSKLKCLVATAHDTQDSGTACIMTIKPVATGNLVGICQLLIKDTTNG